MVAVVERGGFCGFVIFLLVLWLLYIFLIFEFFDFFLSRKPAPWWSIAGSQMVVPGVFIGFCCIWPN